MTKTEEEIYNEYYNYLKNNFDLCKSHSKGIYDRLCHSPYYDSGKITSESLMIPKVYDRETLKYLEDITLTTHKICLSIVDRYFNDENYRKLFPFSRELESLILKTYNCCNKIPLARYDIFYNEITRDFGFCEFNADGSSGMEKNLIHDESYTDNVAHQFVKTKYQIRPFELFHSFVEEFLTMFQEFNKTDTPSIAIVDFLELGRVSEFKKFARCFQAHGVNAYVCDIRSLTFDGHTLYTDTGFPVNAIYRRACTGDIMDRLDEVKPFIEAITKGNIFMCGPFATQIIHCKSIFMVMHHPLTHSFLSDSDVAFIKAHVPETFIFNDTALKTAAISSKDAYILKPLDAYACHGVYAGVEFSQSEWKEIVEKSFGDGYIIQKFMPQYTTKNINMAYSDEGFKDYINMTGLYCYNGKMPGFYNRMSDGGIIRSYVNEKMVPSYRIL